MSERRTGLPEPDAPGALRRMLIVLTIAVGILVYSYGWTVTEIDLSVPQEAQRQTTLTRALRELLSPRIFEQEREVFTAETSFLMDCTTGDVPVQPEPISTEAIVIIEPACANANDIVTIRVLNGQAGAEGRLRWIPPANEGETANARPLELLELEREEFVLGANGLFTGTIEVPRIRGGAGQVHTLRLLIAYPAGPIVLSETALQVIDRMVQTIYMALVATSVAIPIAALISFFAARNLMRSVRLSVGTMLMAFIMFTVGAWLGATFFLRIGHWGVVFGKGDVGQMLDAITSLDALLQGFRVLLTFILPIAILTGIYLLLQMFQRRSTAPDSEGATVKVLKQVARTTVITLLLIFLVGVLAGVSILLGNAIMNFANFMRPETTSGLISWLNNTFWTLIWSIGNILQLFGTLVELFLNAIVAVLAGIALASIAGTLFGSSLRRVTGVTSHILAAVMGALSGAIVMVVAASFGLWATLLGLLPPLVGAILGGQVLLQIVNRLRSNSRKRISSAQLHRRDVFLYQAVFAVGAVAVFYLMFTQLHIGRALVDGTLPSQNPAIVFGNELPISAYTFVALLFGAVLAGISGLIAGVQAVFPLGDVLYNTSRTTLNIVRSIEPLIMGLVFVIWVGIGPFAGVLALTLHSIASLGKLYSEQVENIDPGPLEALQSTGANQLQTIVYAVVPQIIPPYIAFTMYRWDINVRMSTIIGFVGGGGIGLLLQQQINLLRYRDAGVAVLAIAIVVSVLDYASAYIRERVT